jgi:hypothetical protein
MDERLQQFRAAYCDLDKTVTIALKTQVGNAATLRDLCKEVLRFRTDADAVRLATSPVNVLYFMLDL